MKIKFSDQGAGLYLVTVSFRSLTRLFGIKTKEFIYANKRGADALVDASTGKHVFGRFRRRVQRQFRVWQIQEVTR